MQPDGKVARSLSQAERINDLENRVRDLTHVLEQVSIQFRDRLQGLEREVTGTTWEERPQEASPRNAGMSLGAQAR